MLVDGLMYLGAGIPKATNYANLQSKTRHNAMCYTVKYAEVPQCDRCKEEQRPLHLDEYKACLLPGDERRFTRDYDRHCRHGFANVKHIRRRGLPMTCRECEVARFRAGRAEQEDSIDPGSRLPSEGRYRKYTRSEGRYSECTESGDETETPSSPRTERTRPKHLPRPPPTEYDDESESSSSQIDRRPSLRRSSRRGKSIREEFSEDDTECSTTSTQRSNVSARRDTSSRSESAISSSFGGQSDLSSRHTGTSTSVDSRSRTEDSSSSESRSSRRHRRFSAEEEARIRERVRERWEPIKDGWLQPARGQRRH